MSLKDRLRKLFGGGQTQNSPETNIASVEHQAPIELPRIEHESVREVQYLQWYEADEGRLRREYSEFKEKYSNFEIYPLGDGRMGWKGDYSIGEKEYYKIAIVYPYYYPFEPPKVYVLEPEIDTKELEDDGSIPVFSIPGKEWDTTLTAKEIFTWALEWLHFKNVDRKERFIDE